MFVQFVVAILGTLALLLGVRPVAKRHLTAGTGVLTGSDALVGRTAVVLAQVDAQDGRVRLNGAEWSARSFDEDQVLPIGTEVRVMKIHGATAVVLHEDSYLQSGRAVMTAGLIAAIVVLVLVLFVLARSVRIVPQAKAAVIERLGRYTRTATPGLTLLVPFVDRMRPMIDLREQVVSFPPQPVITSDNLTVGVDSVIYFQVTEPRAATYEIAELHPGGRAAHDHHAAQRHRLAEPRAGADQPRRDQQQAARRAGRGDRARGASGSPGSRSRRSTRRRPSRTRWSSRCAPTGTSAR